MTRRSRPLTRFAALALASAVGVAAAAPQLTLGEHSFDWTTVEQERAHFAWSAEVINDSNAPFEVTVAVDLLDDDDSSVASRSGCAVRGATAKVTVPAGQSRAVRNEGSLTFDCAADVVSFRFRLDPTPPERP